MVTIIANILVVIAVLLNVFTYRSLKKFEAVLKERERLLLEEHKTVYRIADTQSLVKLAEKWENERKAGTFYDSIKAYNGFLKEGHAEGDINEKDDFSSQTYKDFEAYRNELHKAGERYTKTLQEAGILRDPNEIRTDSKEIPYHE